MSGCVDFDISSLSNITPIEAITNNDLQLWVENRVGIVLELHIHVYRGI